MWLAFGHRHSFIWHEGQCQRGADHHTNHADAVGSPVSQADGLPAFLSSVRTRASRRAAPILQTELKRRAVALTACYHPAT